VRLATQAYLIELCAEVERLQRERKTHCTIAVDELKFLVSDQITTALATLAGFRANLVLAAQSYAQLENPGDKRINGRALAREIEVGCQVKLLYKAADERTAEWGEALSGTQWLRTPRLEKVEVNKHGGEQWSDSRALERTEHPVISRNTLLSLDQRVAVAYLPKRLPTPIFTCWVKTDKDHASWEPRESAPPDTEDMETNVAPHPPQKSAPEKRQPYA
jgi:type IV secretory pathway TraG/TraD family ATPase VirD4